MKKFQLFFRKCSLLFFFLNCYYSGSRPPFKSFYLVFFFLFACYFLNIFFNFFSSIEFFISVSIVKYFKKKFFLRWSQQVPSLWSFIQVFFFLYHAHFLHVFFCVFGSLSLLLEQGSPTPGLVLVLVLVRGLIGTGPHSRRWVAGDWVTLRLYLQPLPITALESPSHPPRPTPGPWKNCFPQNQFLLPKMLFSWRLFSDVKWYLFFYCKFQIGGKMLLKCVGKDLSPPVGWAASAVGCESLMSTFLDLSSCAGWIADSSHLLWRERGGGWRV